MNTHFEWSIEEDGESFAPAIDSASSLLRPMLRRACLLLLAGLSIALLGAWIGARFRYRQAVARATFEIQDMLDLEAQALASCDRRRFLGLQDSAAPRWFDHQAQRFDAHCAPTPAIPAQPYASSTLGLPARVQKVTLNGDRAWAQVVADQRHEQYARFYRWTEQGWVQALPDPSFWGEPTAWQHEGLLVQATARDRPYGERLAAHVWDVAQDVCGALGCAEGLELRVTFLPDATGQLPRLSVHGLLLPSPWLTGIPADGEISSASLDRLTYWTTYYVASAAVDNLGSGSLNPTQQAILAEYARFHTEGDIASAPILRRIADRQGIDALPTVLRSLPDARALASFLPRWLSLPADRPDTYYAVLVEVAHDPATRACRETFGLLLRQEDAGWMEWLEGSEGQFIGG